MNCVISNSSYMLFSVVIITSLYLHVKSTEICIKTKSITASFLFKGQVIKLQIGYAGSELRSRMNGGEDSLMQAG